MAKTKLMHPNVIFIINNYILINAIPDKKKKRFEVKLFLNKKYKFKLIHQNLVIEFVSQMTENFSLQRK